jgi:outer membrane protein TolC
MYATLPRIPVWPISFAIPIFDWGEKKARVNAQKVAQTIAKLEQENQQIELNGCETDWRRLENLRSQIDIAEKSVRNAQLTYDLNLTRYREGDLTGWR